MSSRFTLAFLVLMAHAALAAPFEIKAERISAPIPSNYEIFGARLRWENGKLAGLVTGKGDCHWENGDPLPVWVCRDAATSYRFAPVFELRGHDLFCKLPGAERHIGTANNFLGFKRVRLDPDVVAAATHDTLALRFGPAPQPARVVRFQQLFKSAPVW
jgi:hypothetical protein